MLPTPLLKDLDYDKVYEPSEDSYLLLDCFEEELPFLQKRLHGSIPIVTEIGTGSGIVTSFIQQHILPGSIFITTDINPHACRTVLKTVKHNSATANIDSCQMSLTTAIRSETIDVLVFNPPYVPATEVPEVPTTEEDDTWLDLALLGGEDGMVTTWQVLNDLENILSPNDGVAYILFCARNKPIEVAEIMREKGWTVDVVVHRKAGWEVLSVLRFMKN
jgi:release factor glutamine methyltransferase